MTRADVGYLLGIAVFCALCVWMAAAKAAWF